MCMQNHECEDGTGYPHRLMDDEIHDYARICSIAEVYDVLSAELFIQEGAFAVSGPDGHEGGGTGLFPQGNF